MENLSALYPRCQSLKRKQRSFHKPDPLQSHSLQPTYKSIRPEVPPLPLPLQTPLQTSVGVKRFICVPFGQERKLKSYSLSDQFPDGLWPFTRLCLLWEEDGGWSGLTKPVNNGYSLPLIDRWLVACSSSPPVGFGMSKKKQAFFKPFFVDRQLFDMLAFYRLHHRIGLVMDRSQGNWKTSS